MNFRRLALRNFIGNFRTYSAYFLSSVFSVFVFYIFAMLLFHPQLQKNLSKSVEISELAKVGMTIALIVIALLSLVFLWYTFVSILKRRKRDLGIYVLLGIEDRDLKKLLFLENFLLGMFATGVGILVGMLLSKLLLLVTQRMMGLLHPLTFQLSLYSFLLTIGTFTLLFLFISLISVQRIKEEQVASLLKEDQKPEPEPSAHWVFSFFGIVLLFLSYASVFIFARGLNNSLYPLLFGVLGTILATILCVRQLSVFLLKKMKKSPNFLKGTKLLSLNDAIFRMKENAMLYSLLSLSMTVAFVGIGIMLAINDRQFSSIQGPTFSYIFHQGHDSDSLDKSEQIKVVNEVKGMIDKEGYQSKLLSMPIVSTWFDLTENSIANDPGYSMNSFSLISETNYKKMMKLMGEKPQAIQDDQILELARSYKIKKKLESLPVKNRQATYNFEIGNEKKKMQLVHSPQMVSLDMYVAVVTDKTFRAFEEIEKNDSAYYPTYSTILDYNEWHDNPQLTQRIADYTTKHNQEIQRKSEQIRGELTEEELQGSEYNKLNTYENKFVYSKSKEETLRESKQGNGLITMITVLIGSVFFIFSAAILYFRLFSDLEKEGAYHRSLHVLGVSKEDRQKLVGIQLRLMYFLPTIIAIAHFVVALAALRVIVELPVWNFFGKIVGCFVIFQFCFYLVSSIIYQRQLNEYAEKNR